MQSLEAATGGERLARKAFLDLDTSVDSPLLNSLGGSDVGDITITDTKGAMLATNDAFDLNRGSGAPTIGQAMHQREDLAAAGSGATPVVEAKQPTKLVALLSKLKRVSALTLQLTDPQNIEEVTRTLPDALNGVGTTLNRLTLMLPLFDASMGASLSALIASPDSRLQELHIVTTRIPIDTTAVFGLAEALRSNTGLRIVSMHNVAPGNVDECFSIVQNALDGNVMRKSELLCRINDNDRTLSTELIRTTT